MQDDEKHILYGGPIPMEYKITNNSLGEYMLEKLQELGNTVLLIDGLTGNEKRASQLLMESIQLANSLKKIGIKPGDIVGIYSENRFEFAHVSLATIYLGATLTAFNIIYTENELSYTMNLSCPKIVFASSGVIEKLLNIKEKCPFIETIVELDSNMKNDHKNVIPYRDFLLSSLLISSLKFDCEPIDIMDNICVILYSSGTTGLPKAVQLTQANIMFTMEQRVPFKEITEEIMLTVIPWFHSYGFQTLLFCLSIFKNSVFFSRFNDQKYLETIQKYKITTIYTAPPILVFLSKSSLVNEYDLSSVEIILCGAASLSKSITDNVLQRLSNAMIRVGYGMTEATVALTTQTDKNHKNGGVGALKLGLWGKVIDLQTGETLGPNQPGELLFKGPVIMKGYLNNLEATKEIIDEDGWLHTGDIGYYDNDKEWFIIDRLKELIKYKGHQVPPAEIEAILLQHPCIVDAAVIGQPDNEAGELPLAFVVKRNGQTPVSEEEIIDFVSEKVSPVKRLRGGVRFIKAIPKSPAGKILRKELKILLSNK